MLRRAYFIFVTSVLVGFSGLSSICRAENEPSFEAPTGLTLQAKAAGRYLLLWEPLDKTDALMGYSIWLRRKGEKEFIHLNVPVKVGKEIQKQPMISDAKVELKLGEGKENLEFSIVAEYENGPSARSESVFSAKAARVLTKTDPPMASLNDAIVTTGTAATELVPKKKNPYEEEEQKPDPIGRPPWELRSSLSKRPLLVPPGKWRTSVGVSFDYMRYVSASKDPFVDLRLFIPGTPYASNQVVAWKRTDIRTRAMVPLKARLGLLPGLEAWAEIAYAAEDVSVGEATIEGKNYDNISSIRFRPDGSFFYLSNPTSATISDTMAGLRIQPLASTPLVLGVMATVPTGLSKLKARIDRLAGAGSPAGTGEGVLRLGARADLGWRGIRQGLSGFAKFSPGVPEQFTYNFGNYARQYVLTRGDQAEAGIGFTFPWNVLNRDGAIVVEASGRAEGVGRYFVDGNDVSASFSKFNRSYLAAETGIQFVSDNSFEVAVDALQTLPGGFETGGRFSYRSGLLGDQFSLSGRLVY